MVHGWRDSRVLKVSQNHYRFKNYKDLKTFRIDDTQLFPDYSKSQNIIGHNFHEGSLYVHLGGATQASLVLTKKKGRRPYIESCNGFVKEFVGKTITGSSRVPFEATIVTSEGKQVLRSKKAGMFKLKGDGN